MRRRGPLACLFVLLACTVFVLFPRQGASQAPKELIPAAEVAEETPKPSLRPTMAVNEASKKPAEASLIADVLLDRTEICAGEPVVVTVVPRPSKDGQPVRVDIHGAPSNPAAITLNQPGRQKFIVRAARGAILETREVDLVVHECGPIPALAVRAEPLDGKPGHFLISAVPFFANPNCLEAENPKKCEATPENGDVLSFSWDFGDGAKEVTKTRTVEHDYSKRAQDDDVSNFFVRATLVSQREGSILGYTNVKIPNIAFTNKRLGYVVPLARSSRVAEKNEKEYAFDVTMDTPGKAEIYLKEARVVLTRCGGAGEAKETIVGAGDVLDQTSISPGETTIRAHLPRTLASDEFCSVTIQATGISLDKSTVQVGFGTMFVDETATEIDSDTEDPALKRQFDRTQRALKILGRDSAQGPVTITESEIHRLERQGLLD